MLIEDDEIVVYLLHDLCVTWNRLSPCLCHPLCFIIIRAPPGSTAARRRRRCHAAPCHHRSKDHHVLVQYYIIVATLSATRASSSFQITNFLLSYFCMEKGARGLSTYVTTQILFVAPFFDISFLCVTRPKEHAWWSIKSLDSRLGGVYLSNMHRLILG